MKAYQSQLELYFKQYHLFEQFQTKPANDESQSQQHQLQHQASNGHDSNPNNPIFPGAGPKPVLEEGKGVFNNGFFFVNEIVFSIRENPALAEGVFQAIMDSEVKSYYRESKFVENLTLMFFDNPFQDTSKCEDTNLQYFNILRAFNRLMNKDLQSKYKIASKDDLNNHVASQIFSGLTKIIEAQSYLRFIFRNIFSKINLIQLIGFINEKEAQWKALNQAQIKQQQQPQKEEQKLTQQQQQKNFKLSMSLVNPNDQKNLLENLQPQKNKDEGKKDLQAKQKKPGMLKKLFGGGSKDKDKKALQAKLQAQQNNKYRETYDPRHNLQNCLLDEAESQNQKQERQSSVDNQNQRNQARENELGRINLTNDQSIAVTSNMDQGSNQFNLSPNTDATTSQQFYSSTQQQDHLDFSMNIDKINENNDYKMNEDDNDLMSQAAMSDVRGNFDSLINQRISRMDVSQEIRAKFVIKQYDLTGYMIHILMKVTEILYLSVCQIPNPLRAYIKILADSIQRNKPDISKADLYRILNDLLIDKWLSQSFSIPEFYGILPKPLNFLDKHKYIFFQTAQKFRENIMTFYEYLLNIDISIYQCDKKDSGLLESLVIRLDDVKKLLALLNSNMDNLKNLDQNIEDNLARLDSRCSLESILDDNFGLIKANAAFEVDDDHFGRTEDPNHEQKNFFDLESQIKFLFFAKAKENNSMQQQKYLKQLLEKETDEFIGKHQIQDRMKFRQMLRNIQELISQDEVQFPSIHQIIRNKKHDFPNDLSVILFFLIRGDECLSQGRDGSDKDKMRLQCMILYKNLQQIGFIGNTRMQCKVIKHLIKKTSIRVQNVEQDISKGRDSVIRQSESNDIIPQFEQIGLESLQLMFFCIQEDIESFLSLIRTENDYIWKVQHSLYLSYFISTVKPFVCLNFDPSNGGFNLVRQDKCDKHQANPLLTGQLLFGIVQTNNPGNNRQAGRVPNQQAANNNGPQTTRGTATGQPSQQQPQGRRQDQMSSMIVDPYQNSNNSKVKHYQLKRIDLALGQAAREIDSMNLRTTYNQFLQVVKNLLENDQHLSKNITHAQNEINEYIMRQLHRHIFVLIEPSQVDIEIQRNLQKNHYTFQTLDFPEELQDESLWIDAISAFDKFSKEETPMEKLQVVLRTVQICSQVYHMANIKDNKEMTFDEEINMLTYVVYKSISAFKLYSNYQFIKLFNVELKNGNSFDKALNSLEAVISYILQQQ
ncbi:UNKNOWN [Stylonychia lemnae]|uniref:VPS9 domain-containing protein n=1 Tax=Stylonychia lemnae TaxID=5949 RepID=A0A078AG95_STYLE|nr:UNKNOWN [Stylonychia lemnae]|eukprot:CDW80527.1 UNKNOWN [Stylonychia lemnae]